MSAIVNLYSDKPGEIQRFINKYLNDETNTCNELKWEKSYENPIDISDIIGIFIENNDKFKINMWISFDKNIFINVTENNADKIIRYIYERFPY